MTFVNLTATGDWQALTTQAHGWLYIQTRDGSAFELSTDAAGAAKLTIPENRGFYDGPYMGTGLWVKGTADKVFEYYWR